MPQSILQTFLNEHIIAIEGNEEFALLSKAAIEFEKLLRKKKQRISQVAQVAFDPAVKPTEPLIAEVQELITSKWKAFPSKCHDKPVPYVRAVMLAALQKLAEEINFAGIIWLTVSNYFPFAEATQREATVLREFLGEAGNAYQQASWNGWGLNKSYEAPKLPEIVPISISPATSVNPEYAPKRLAATISGTDADTNQHVFANYTRQNGYNTTALTVEEEWITSFSDIAGKAITTIATTIISSINKSLAEAASSKQLAVYTEAITNYLREVGDSMSRQTSSHNLRSQLLWVKESMYSTGQKNSYRRLSLAVVPLALASDAADMVPEIYPISIDFFLREMLAEANAAVSSPLK